MMLFWKAVRAGEVLADPGAWKNRQNLINALVAVIAALVWVLGKLGFGLALSTDEMMAVAGGVAVLMGAVNTYLTTATTTKIGL